jgi:tRNA A-37 threonylcarbamoyl transferase component Bud32
MSERPDNLPNDPTTSAVTVAVGSSSTPTPAGARFTPGSIVAGRYRLVALLGRGGMAEVYRADDLTLNQTVALKFLPATDLRSHTAESEARLERLHNELRLARQISHKNVCRLYDLGDADGRRFLTMEYVDGEDLASLLRRIGRIPEDKAIQIARQLCAGVAAAHERGVLHRDLKPNNVMIDGEGNVRITDFGIATASGDAGTDIAGTPQYMAPEQLAGHRASIKTDIYALGLILFEIFTGRRVNEAKTIADIREENQTRTVTLPSSIVRDLDPAVERVILRCLERDPDRRPASALTVAAALPGGDPLAAALAAGETPSPDLLAAAGESEAIPVNQGLTMALSFIVVLFVFAAVASRASLPGLVPMDKPPDVLEDRAQQIVKALGYPSETADRASGFAQAQDYLRWEQNNGRPGWWKSLSSARPTGLWFWYRSSPREFAPIVPGSGVTPVDPPMNVSGMHQMFLDTRGRLVEFHSVPAQVDAEEGRPVTPIWRALFDAAELNFDAFTPDVPRWTPRDFADERAAWEGVLPDRPDIKVRVEAAAFRGLPVSFIIVGPWTQATRMQPVLRTPIERASSALTLGFFVLVLLGGALLARQNVLLNRADLRGAARLAIAVTIALLVSGVLTAHQVGTAVFGALGSATRFGSVVWLLYLAIEPYARRLWPDALLGWTRLLSGRVFDSRIGRDVLIGLSFAAVGLMLELFRLLPLALGRTEIVPPFGNALTTLTGPLLLLARWVVSFSFALQISLIAAMVFVVLRLFLKQPWMVLAAGIAVLVLVRDSESILSGNWFDMMSAILSTALVSYAVYRHGLLVLTVALFVRNVVLNVPLTLSGGVWWATPSNLTLALLVAMAAFGYYAARAGQPLFGRVLRDQS